MAAPLSPYSWTHTPELPGLLAQLDCSLVFSAYQAGKIVLIASDGERLLQSSRAFDTPMGLALDGPRLAVATRHELVALADGPPMDEACEDTRFVPDSSYRCGPLKIHDIAYGEDGLVGVNTLFSCLFRLDPDDRLVSTWHPPFVTDMASEDRCHLNGMAMENGKPKYVSALGSTDTRQGWRQDKLDGGVLLDVPSSEFVARNLAMPHSPRLFDGELYLLLSSAGELVRVDVDTGAYEVVTKLNAFVRGMARHGDYLFVGCSLLRNSHTFDDLPMAKDNTSFCGIAVVHFQTGSLVGRIHYLNSCEEIYDVQVLPNGRNAGITRE